MNNRLIHGNTLEIMDELIEEGIKVDAIITDLPYSVTNLAWDKIIPFEPMWERFNKLNKHNGAIVLTAQQPFTSALISSNYKIFKYCYYWEKERLTNIAQVKRRAGKTVEECCIFYNKQPTYNPQMIKYTGAKRSNKVKNGKMGVLTDSNEKAVKEYEDTGWRYPTQVLKIQRDILTSNYHPTQKPVALMEFFVKTFTNERDTVLDCTMGSGSTGVACKNLNRNFIGIDNGYCEKEKSEFFNWKWVDVAKYRIENEGMDG